MKHKQANHTSLNQGRLKVNTLFSPILTRPNRPNILEGPDPSRSSLLMLEDPKSSSTRDNSLVIASESDGFNNVFQEDLSLVNLVDEDEPEIRIGIVDENEPEVRINNEAVDPLLIEIKVSDDDAEADKGTAVKEDAISEDEVQLAIDSSMSAWKTWSKVGLGERTKIFRKAAELLQGPWRDTINAATMLNQSKNAFQAEIDAACELIDFFNFNCQYAEDIYGNQPLISPEGVTYG